MQDTFAFVHGGSGEGGGGEGQRRGVVPRRARVPPFGVAVAATPLGGLAGEHNGQT